MLRLVLVGIVIRFFSLGNGRCKLDHSGTLGSRTLGGLHLLNRCRPFGLFCRHALQRTGQSGLFRGRIERSVELCVKFLGSCLFLSP